MTEEPKSKKRVFKYNTRIIGQATGKGVATVRRHLNEGLFKLDDLASVAEYIVVERMEKGTAIRAIFEASRAGRIAK